MPPIYELKDSRRMKGLSGLMMLSKLNDSRSSGAMRGGPQSALAKCLIQLDCVNHLSQSKLLSLFIGACASRERTSRYDFPYLYPEYTGFFTVFAIIRVPSPRHPFFFFYFYNPVLYLLGLRPMQDNTLCVRFLSIRFPFSFYSQRPREGCGAPPGGLSRG